MGRFPGEDTVNTQEPGMSESKFRLGSHIRLLQALDEVYTPYPLTLVRFTHSIARGYVVPLMMQIML